MNLKPNLEKQNNHIIAVDGSFNSTLAFEYAASNFPKTDELVLLNAKKAEFSKGLNTVFYDPKKKHEKLPEIHAAYARRCADWNRKCSFVSVDYSTLSDIALQTQLIASQKESKSVVVGSRGLGGLQRTLLGSVSYTLVNKLNVPVTVVKSPKVERDTSGDFIFYAVPTDAPDLVYNYTFGY